jgi:hypothetical protein
MSSVTRPPSSGRSSPVESLNGRRNMPLTNATPVSRRSGPIMPVAKWGENARVSESM